MASRDYQKWLSVYLQKFISRDGNVYKPLSRDDIFVIAEHLISSRNLREYVSELSVNNDLYCRDRVEVQLNVAHPKYSIAGRYNFENKKLRVRYDSMKNPFDIILTILHELAHAEELKQVCEIESVDDINVINALYVLDFKVPTNHSALKNYAINKPIKEFLNRRDFVDYLTSPLERYARLNSMYDVLMIMQLMHLEKTPIYDEYINKYKEYLDYGYYYLKDYNLNPTHIFLLKCYNNGLLKQKRMIEFLDALDELTKELDSDTCHFLGLKYDSNKKSNKNV